MPTTNDEDVDALKDGAAAVGDSELLDDDDEETDDADLTRRSRSL